MFVELDEELEALLEQVPGEIKVVLSPGERTEPVQRPRLTRPVAGRTREHETLFVPGPHSSVLAAELEGESSRQPQRSRPDRRRRCGAQLQQRLEPQQTLAKVAAAVPVRLQRLDEPEAERALRPLDRPGQRRTDVVELELDPVNHSISRGPRAKPRASSAKPRKYSACRRRSSSPSASPRASSRSSACSRIVPSIQKRPSPAASLLLSKFMSTSESSWSREAEQTALGCPERAAAGKDREAGKALLLLLLEQLVTPVDRGPQRLLAIGEVTRPAGQ